MSIVARMLPEFDHEMSNTRRLLEIVPEDKFDWQPHERSFTLRQMVSHIANLPTWMAPTIQQDSLDMAPEGGEPIRTPQAQNKAELLSLWDKNAALAREVFAKVNDAELMKNWSLKMTGKEIFSMPKIAVIRSFIFNHIIHHRGQLTVYLRLLNVPFPGMYGPSADDRSM